MQDLLTNPIWQEETLGQPLPPSPHAVSVSLPCWKHVIGYEEGDVAVTSRMQAGYPRFFIPRVNLQLEESVLAAHGEPGQTCLIFPSEAAVSRAATYVLNREDIYSLQTLELTDVNLWALLGPAECRASMRLYWRFSGETVSSRRATAALEKRPDSSDGDTAKATIRARLARLAKVSPADIFLFPSGMAAVFAVHRLLMELWPERQSVQLDFPYVDVLKVQEQFGDGVHFYPMVTEESLQQISARAAGQELHGVFCEAPSNPLLSCVPMARLSALLKPHGVPLIIDDTVASVVNVDALKFADIVTTSLTKSFSGTGDVLAGAVTLNPRSPHYEQVRAWFETELAQNDIFWGEDAIELERNSRDFPKRVRRSSQNAAALANYLEQHPAVKNVYYPQLAPEGISEILRPGGGRGCLLSFTLDDPSAAPAVYDALKIAKGPSLGTNFTICCPYTLLAHYTELPWAAECGLDAHLLRVSLGLEEIDDLITRFGQALPQALVKKPQPKRKKSQSSQKSKGIA
jgi:cystathionine gamma-synthase